MISNTAYFGNPPSITRCFHPDKMPETIEFRHFEFLEPCKVPNDLLVKQIVDFHCNQVDAIKWIRFTCFNNENWTIFRIVAKWYFGNNHSFTFKITSITIAAIISRRLMILTKCDSMLFLLLIVYLLILSHLWKKGNFKYFQGIVHNGLDRMHTILSFLGRWYHCIFGRLDLDFNSAKPYLS